MTKFVQRTNSNTKRVYFGNKFQKRLTLDSVCKSLFGNEILKIFQKKTPMSFEISQIKQFSVTFISCEIETKQIPFNKVLEMNFIPKSSMKAKPKLHLATLKTFTHRAIFMRSVK